MRTTTHDGSDAGGQTLNLNRNQAGDCGVISKLTEPIGAPALGRAVDYCTSVLIAEASDVSDVGRQTLNLNWNPAVSFVIIS